MGRGGDEGRAPSLVLYCSKIIWAHRKEAVTSLSSLPKKARWRETKLDMGQKNAKPAQYRVTTPLALIPVNGKKNEIGGTIWTEK